MQRIISEETYQRLTRYLEANLNDETAYQLYDEVFGAEVLGEKSLLREAVIVTHEEISQWRKSGSPVNKPPSFT